MRKCMIAKFRTAFQQLRLDSLMSEPYFRVQRFRGLQMSVECWDLLYLQIHNRRTQGTSAKTTPLHKRKLYFYQLGFVHRHRFNEEGTVRWWVIFTPVELLEAKIVY